MTDWAIDATTWMGTSNGYYLQNVPGLVPPVIGNSEKTYYGPGIEWHLRSLASDYGEFWGFALQSGIDQRFVSVDPKDPYSLPVRLVDADSLDIWAAWTIANPAVQVDQAITAVATLNTDHAVLSIYGTGTRIPVITQSWQGGWDTQLWRFGPQPEKTE